VTVLVTGAGGFVGSHVVRKLAADGSPVAALLRPGGSRRRLEGLDEVRVLEADLADSGAVAAVLEQVRPRAVIHCAWYAEPGRYLEGRENLVSLASSLTFCEQLGEAGCKHLVGVGTCAEYDLRQSPLREDTPTRTDTLYAACKLAFFIVASRRLPQLGMGFAWARLFYLYGPYEDERRLVPALVSALLEGREFETTPGEQVRDYLHVLDVAAALCLLSEGRLEGAFNVCSGEPVTIAALLQAVGELLGRPELIHLGALPYREWEPMSVTGDPGRLREEAGWSPKLDLREGLAGTVEWWKRTR
jgi:nucleoside-diphosphate-sugar epimerase